MANLIAWEVNGEVIRDVEAWADEHGEPMVRVKHTWREPLPLAGRVAERHETVAMPRCFFARLRFGGPHDDQYELVEDA